MQYEIIAERDMLKFQEEVTKRMNEGWMLHGELNTESVAVTADDGHTQVTILFMQAVVKEG